MKHTLSLVTLGLLALLPTHTSAAQLPGVCDDVYLDSAGLPIQDVNGTQISRFCELTGPDAPIWADSVCCEIGTEASCTPTDRKGRCRTGIKLWCDYGEVGPDGNVTCYQPLPDACASGYCSIAPPEATQGSVPEPLCCLGEDNCTLLDVLEHCPGEFLQCYSPFTNSDGSIGCADDEG